MGRTPRDRFLAYDGGSPRDRLILYLLFITSDSCRNVLERFIPSDVITTEMCRLWFDDVYIPSNRYMDGLKGDQNPSKVAAFLEHFTDDEAASMERFHAFLDLRLDMVSSRGDLWQNIVRDARYLVEDLEPNEKRRQQIVDWLADLLARDEGPSFLSNGRLRLGPQLTSRNDP